MYLIRKVNDLAGIHGFGRIDMIENRVVGIKSREIYEAPGLMLLIKCHQEIESLTLSADVLRTKSQLERQWADLVYQGFWFSPLKNALDSFIETTQIDVNGASYGITEFNTSTNDFHYTKWQTTRRTNNADYRHGNTNTGTS